MAKKFFKVDARTMLTLGRESIKDHTTALVELVKNSYDAGSTVVEIEISSDMPESRGLIRISDNGHGMDESDITNSWLRIGYSIKREEKHARGGRRRVGEKGIGRISADRLGAILELKSQKKDAPPAGLHVNWNDFDAPGKDIDKIAITELSAPSFQVPHPALKNSETDEFDEPPASSPNGPKQTGTELAISELRQKWASDDIRELVTELMTLTSPFQQETNFQVRLRNDVDPGSDGVISSTFDAIAEVDGTFVYHTNGATEVTLISRDIRGKQRKPTVLTIPWSEFVHPRVADSEKQKDLNSDTRRTSVRFGPVSVRLLFFPRSKDTVRGTELSLSDLRAFLDIHEGIKIYRDGIRVLPYGDLNKPDGDWLGLDDRQSQNPAGAGRKSFRVKASQLVGAVFLTRDKNPHLVDTSGREGLVEGDAFNQLKQFLIGCVVQLEAHYHEVFTARSEDSTPTQSPREQVDNLDQDLRTLAENLRGVQASLPRTAGKTVEKIRDQIGDTAKLLSDTRKSIEELASQATIYRGLATLGIAAATFGHETSASIDSLFLHVNTARNLLQHDSDVDPETVISELEESLKVAQHVSSWGEFALRRLNRDKRRRRKLNIHDVVTDLVEEMKPLLANSDVGLVARLRSVEGRAFEMDVESVVVNLMANAYYFCKQKQRNRMIHVGLSEKQYDGSRGCQLVVSDSGPGIPSRMRNRVWTPLFTTKVDSKGRPAGTGLGLSIVDSVVKDMRGQREIDSDPELGGARITIWLPLH